MKFYQTAQKRRRFEAALEAGYPLIEIYNDPELSKLRQDPAYHRLLAKTQAE